MDSGQVSRFVINGTYMPNDMIDNQSKEDSLVSNAHIAADTLIDIFFF